MLKEEISLKKNNILRVKGPLSLVLTKGSLRIFGYIAKPPFKYIVPSYKSAALIANEDSEVSIIVGENGKYEVVEKDIVIEWENVSREILEAKEKPLIIVVTGTVDSGKSTFTTLLANMSANLGFKTAVVDADIGQADIGPPTFVTLGFIDKQYLTLTEVEPAMYSFIGTTTPYGVIDRLILSIVKLSREALRREAQVVVVNTDGWFKGSRAVEAKFKTIFHVKPDAVFIIRKNTCLSEIERLKNVLRNFNVDLRIIEPPEFVKERSLEERRSIRELAYTRYFKDSEIRELSLEEVSLLGLDILSGRILENKELDLVSEILSLPKNSKIVLGTLANKTMYLIVRGNMITINMESMRKLRENYGPIRLKILREGWEKGLIVSILNRDMEEVAIGYIESIDFENSKIKVRTTYRGEIGGLIVGNIKLHYDKETGVVREQGKWSL